jgi:hypothetical protein
VSTVVVRQAVSGTSPDTTATVALATTAATQVGDLFVMICGRDDSSGGSAGLLTPTGGGGTWTLQATADPSPGATGVPHMKVWTQPCSTAGAQTLTANQTTAQAALHAHLFVLSGVGAAFAVAATGGSATASLSHVCPAVAPNGLADLLICAAASGFEAGPINYTPPSGMAGDTETDQGTFSTMRAFSVGLTAAGTTGTKTATASVSSKYASVSLAITGVGPAPLQGTPPGRLAPNARWRIPAQLLADSTPTAGSSSASPAAGLATGTGAANDATVTTAVAATAGLATGTGAANAAVPNVGPRPTAATGTGTGNPATISTIGNASPGAGAATGVGTANAPAAGATGQAGTATGTGAAYGATVITAVLVLPSTATGVGTAHSTLNGVPVISYPIRVAPADLAARDRAGVLTDVAVRDRAGTITDTAARDSATTSVDRAERAVAAGPVDRAVRVT